MTTGTVKWFNAKRAMALSNPTMVERRRHISAVERAGMGHLQEVRKLNYQLERGAQGKTSAVDLKTEN